MLRRLAAILLATTLPRSAATQLASVPSDTLLAGITARGRSLAAYDRGSLARNGCLAHSCARVHTRQNGQHHARLAAARRPLDCAVRPSNKQPGHFVQSFRSPAD